MLETMMPLTGDESMKTSKPKYAGNLLADSKEFLNALKKECLERKALTRVERLKNIDALQVWSTYIVKPNHRDQSMEATAMSHPAASQPKDTELEKMDDGPQGRESSCEKGAEPTSNANGDSASEGRVYFLSENYENVSGDESSTSARPLESTNGATHEMIERFLPLVDAMEQVVPTDTDDVLEEGGLIIDDADSPTKQVSTVPVAAEEKDVIQNEGPERECDADTSQRQATGTGISCVATPESKDQTSEPKVKRARSSKARKSSLLLEKLRGAGKKEKGERRGAQHRSRTQRGVADTQPKDKGSGSEVFSDDDSSTTTLDGTECPSSSDDENQSKVPKTEDAAAKRHGVKRLVRTAEELRKSIVKDPLNEESRYNRLVQELPGFNWLEQKIMGHNSTPVKAPLAAPPPLNGKEVLCQQKYCDGEVKPSATVDILSRSMSEIQGDEAFTENNEEQTIIKCVSTQTELSRNTPTPDRADQPSTLKSALKSRPSLACSAQSPTAMTAPTHTRLHPIVESEGTWEPRKSPADADVMYIGAVEKPVKSESRKYPSAAGHPQSSPGPPPLPWPKEVHQQAAGPDVRQRAVLETDRQFLPWFLRPEGRGPPALSPTGVPQAPVHGLSEMCHQTPLVHNAVAMPTRMFRPPYIQMPHKTFQGTPLPPQGEMSHRMNNMPFNPYFGFPGVFMPPYPRPSVQHVQQPNDSGLTSDGRNVSQEKNAVGLKVPQSTELQKELQKNQKEQKSIPQNVSNPPRPSAAVAPQNHPQPPHQDHRNTTPHQGRYPSTRRPPADRVKAMRSPPEAQRGSPAKRTESTELPPLAIVHSTLPREPTRTSPAVLERQTPDKHEITQNAEQELLKRKDELKYLDQLASQKEAEYERIVQMRTEKLRILTELENRIKATSEAEKRDVKKSPPGVVPHLAYAHQATRTAKEAGTVSDNYPPRPRPKPDNDIPTSKLPQSASSITPPRNIPGLQYPIQSPPSAAIPVTATANIPLTVPLIGRGLFNVRSIDIPREVSQVMLNDDAVPGRAENGPYYHNDQYNRHIAANMPQNPQVKRAHSATDMQKQQEESRRMPAPPQPSPPHPTPPHPSPTIQRPFPQRVGKPPPVQPETRNTPWSFKDGYRPHLAAYYSQQNYSFPTYYAGGKSAERYPNHGVETCRSGVPHGMTEAQHQAMIYSTPWRDYSARMKFTHTAEDQRERHIDPNSHNVVSADANLFRRPSDDERVLYEQRLAKDIARTGSSAPVREGLYELDHDRNQVQPPQNPQKTPPAKEEPSKCALCGKYAQYLCSGCQSVWYCGQQCQKSNWSNHSSHCQNVKR